MHFVLTHVHPRKTSWSITQCSKQSTLMHFFLTHAHPGKTSRLVTHRSKHNTLSFGVF
jgi:hypothetical protein